jgi:cytochrome c oxidase cbb3-type subunit IV
VDISHEALVGFAKTFGLFYLIALSAGIAVYALWPSNRDRFDNAANSIMNDEDGPCR